MANDTEAKKMNKKQRLAARIDELAKPNHPRPPIKKPPPRAKDEHGLPIYPRPTYGRSFPKVKPFKERDCGEFFREKEEKEATEKLRRKTEREMTIDPIAFKDSIDPYFDPVGAKRQLRARIKMKKILETQEE